ncbi:MULTISPECIES: SUMF1/EgtB/PvdO family nonheme iron enzyme [Bradyrhizobium]|uniref:SUMF1/EgtB/PvdO family nonheme iron enzyme n=1 Tax=Bradyrhizobium TaxID=374 RepID=UPI001EDC620A|nr:SUMF1/EgtB/PvdO family nonheme iron enzyme [Bradyrhizobium zhengyangense]MCG2645597.1 SUMF1/EgtB/PvdO family nonheme iron enzyme [Bradyrhizobium zhengyangense]
MAEIHNIKSGKGGDEPSRQMMPRRLAAIVAGDIAGYSRLMQIDEEGTHVRVKRLERELIEPSIVDHHGKLVKTTGDGFLAIFDSPVEAVRCGIVIQQNMIGRNASLPQHHWIEYRIGVNLGDVIIEADDVYGDGVNIATRLEGIADPGQVYISGGIYEQIKHKLVCGYESLGDRKVKNITDPVRVYRVLPDATAFNRVHKRRENALLILLSLIVLVIAGGVLWYLLVQPHNQMAHQASATATPSAEPPTPAPPALSAAKQEAPLPSSPVLPPPSEQAVPPSQPAPSIVPPIPATVREPEMVSVRGGTFSMGSNDDASERPVHRVTIKPFLIGKYPVTVREWNECAAAKGCAFVATGKDDAPVTNVSWSDAKAFVAWLAAATGKSYRLPSEAEWEFSARGGTQTKYWWGNQLQPGMANCKNCADVISADQPVKVGTFKPNPFELFDMGGGVDQWVEDCWHRTYQGAPSDASPWLGGDCSSHVIRSGSWKNDANYVRPASRDSYDTNVRYPTHGFRVALSP